MEGNKDVVNRPRLLYEINAVILFSDAHLVNQGLPSLPDFAGSFSDEICGIYGAVPETTGYLL